MSLKLKTLAPCFFLAFAFPAFAADASKATYQASEKQIKLDYKVNKAKCDGMKGNPKDVCVAEAKAVKEKALAQAKADYKNTDAARRSARNDIIGADYAVAKAHCGAKTGNDKDVCKKEAKAAMEKAKADVKVSGKVTDARQDAKETKAKADSKANKEVVEARDKASETKRDADYKVAKEKCDALSGAAKDKCIADAKAKYGK